jgi:WD40 repeat protein
VAFSPDRRAIAAGATEAAVYLWDADSGKLLRRLEGPSGGVAALAFAPEGRLITAADRDESIRVWETDTGRQIHRLEGLEKGTMFLTWGPGENSSPWHGKATPSRPGTFLGPRTWDASRGQSGASLP